MNILAVDPGITTGVALFRGRQFIKTMALAHKDGFEIFDHIDAEWVIMEQFPHIFRGVLGDELRQIWEELRQLFPHAVLIQPGTWKSSYWGKKKLDLKFKTPHEQDAYRIGQYAIEHLLREDQLNASYRPGRPTPSNALDTEEATQA